MSLADIQSMKALKLAKKNADLLASSQYTNIIGTTDFVSLSGTGGYPTVDNGANDNNCPVYTSSAFTLQKYKVNVKIGRKYLCTIKIKGTTVTNTTFEVIPRYTGTATAVTGYAPPSSYVRSITKTGAFDYQQLAVVCTMDNASYSAIDFTISLAQPNKDTVWAYKEVMVTDVTGYTTAQINELINYGYFSASVSKTKIVTKWSNKNVLAIGDSLTAALKWQNTVASIHGCSITTSAKGGIGLVPMVDGDATDPILPALTVSDVTGKDLIILFGGMNERDTTFGVLGDVYPTNNTLYGRLQYVINKLYSLLQTANNLTCKIILVTPHCCGKYGYNDVDGYGEYPTSSGQTLEKLANNIVTCGNYNNLRVVDLWHKSGVGKNTWNVYMASSTATLGTPIPANPYPNNADQVHFNDTGYALIGGVIAAEMNLL